MNKVDLHLHSNYSDGTWSPAELANHAIKLGLSTISLTDHDTINGLGEAKEALKGKVAFIDGVEISTRLKLNDIIVEENLHVLGYFIDSKNQSLQDILEKNRVERLNYAKSMVSQLKAHGVGFELSDVESFSRKGGTIGKSHIANAILKVSGVDYDINEIYKRFFSNNKESQFSIEKKWVQTEEAIASIEKAGGIAVLAHPGFKENTPEILTYLASNGLKGVEVYHHYHDEHARDKLLELSKQLDLIVSGGSDCHGPFEGEEPYMGSQNVCSDYVSKDFCLLSRR